jgi:hypothetical protein
MDRHRLLLCRRYIQVTWGLLAASQGKGYRLLPIILSLKSEKKTKKKDVGLRYTGQGVWDMVLLCGWLVTVPSHI